MSAEAMDDLAAFVQESEAKNPELRKIREDIQTVHGILDQLLALRVKSGLTRKQMAKKLGVKRKVIVEFESESGDPVISMMQRYARVLNFKLEAKLIEVLELVDDASVVHGRPRGSVISHTQTFCSLDAKDVKSSPVPAEVTCGDCKVWF